MMIKNDLYGFVCRLARLACLTLLLSGAGGANTIRAEEEIGEKLTLCISCHGENGIPQDPTVPIVAGQEFYYLYVQLRDYKAGRRTHAVMSEIVADLDKAQMQALAKYFSEQKWPRIAFRTSDSDSASGARAASSGQCPQCHLGSYLGNSRVPRVAGQKASYLSETMLAFKHKRRLNAPAKGSLFASFSDDDIAAMAKYLAGL